MTSDEPEPEAVQLSGPATLYESSEIREALRSAIASGADLRIDLETSGPWDLAGLQLLIACVASGRKAGHSVRLANVTRACAEVAERSGLSGWLAGVADSFL